MSETISTFIDRAKTHVPDGHERCISYDGRRAYMFNRFGDLVTTTLRDGEDDDTLRFRLLAAITALEVSLD